MSDPTMPAGLAALVTRELWSRLVRSVKVTEACHNCAAGHGIWFDDEDLGL